MNNSEELNTWKDFVQTSTNRTGSPSTDYEPSKLSFGANSTLAEPSKGEIAEFILYNKVLSTAERQKIEGYLAHKWVLSLPGGHPYELTAPASQTTWSSVQSFTTPTNVTAPVLGTLDTANVTTTTADLEATLSDNGNAATSLVFYWGDNDGGTNPASWDSNFTISNSQKEL